MSHNSIVCCYVFEHPFLDKELKVLEFKFRFISGGGIFNLHFMLNKLPPFLSCRTCVQCYSMILRMHKNNKLGRKGMYGMAIKAIFNKPPNLKCLLKY